MYSIKQAAEAVALKYNAMTGNRQAATGGSFVDILIMILPAVLEALAACQAARNVPDAAANPGIIQRGFTRGLIRRELDLSRREFREINGTKLADAMLEVAASLNTEQVEDLYSQAV